MTELPNGRCRIILTADECARQAVRHRALHRIVGALFGALLIVMTATASAQQQPPAPTAPPTAPVPDAAPQAPAAATPPPAAVNYLFPDLAPQALVHDGKYFWIRPIFAVVGDYTSFSQDDASLEQVGTQANAPELRAGRIGLTFRRQGKLTWEFYVTADYQEQRNREKTVLQLYDLQLRIPVGPVKITLGKMKETISYELVGLSVLLPQQERILLPFFPSRNVGVNFSGQLAGGRMTWAAGAFNDWLERKVAFGRNATDYVGRVSALAWESPDKREYVHLGLGVRSAGSDEGMMRFSGRPESNVADKYVDTKDFPAKRAEILSLEGLWNFGRFSVLGEHMGSWVDAPERGNPYFSGYYVTGSWLLTGESRPYNRIGGYAGGITPTRRLGAVELVARFSRLDLSDAQIDGGVLNKWHVGVNWWASAQWKIGFSYGDADLDKGGLRGNTKMWLTRIQWLY
jgi:phosphate-selective porin OprO/OprP